MATIKLNTQSSFIPMEAGDTTVRITEAKAVPSARPTHIEVKFENIKGQTVSSNYEIASSKAMVVFTILVRTLLDVQGDEIDTSDIAKLVGKFVDVNIVHVTKPSTKNEGENVVFANVGKILGKGTNPWTVSTPQTHAVSTNALD